MEVRARAHPECMLSLAGQPSRECVDSPCLIYKVVCQRLASTQHIIQAAPFTEDICGASAQCKTIAVI
jgi:hypothetical protein